MKWLCIHDQILHSQIFCKDKKWEGGFSFARALKINANRNEPKAAFLFSGNAFLIGPAQIRGRVVLKEIIQPKVSHTG